MNRKKTRNKFIKEIDNFKMISKFIDLFFSSNLVRTLKFAN